MSIKSYITKKVIQSQLSKLPPEARAMVEQLMEDDPELLMTIAGELKEQVDKGKSQEEALMITMQKHKQAFLKIQMKMKVQARKGH
jgi:hypothetical protein